jgi:hypothetical protein
MRSLGAEAAHFSSLGRGAWLAVALAIPACGRFEQTAPSGSATAAAAPDPPPKTRPPVDPVRIWVKIGKEDISTESGVLVPLPPPDKRHEGVEAKHKRNGAVADMHIAALAKAIPSCHDKPVVIEVEPETTFRLLEEVAFTLAEQECKVFEARVIGDAPREFKFSTPVHADIEAPKVLAEVKEGGISLTTPSGSVGPNCEGSAKGVTIARQEGRLPSGALTLCAAKIKAGTKELATARMVLLAAAPATSCADVADVARALERHGNETLFPEIVIGAAN